MGKNIVRIHFQGSTFHSCSLHSISLSSFTEKKNEEKFSERGNVPPIKHHQNKLPDYFQDPSLSTDSEDCRVVG
jgi:Fe-S cluster biogenesis protein NfuA